VEAGESVKNAEVGRWQVWDTCVQVARPGSCARKGAREPNPRLLMRCRGGKPRRVQAGGDAGVALRCALKGRARLREEWLPATVGSPRLGREYRVAAETACRDCAEPVPALLSQLEPLKARVTPRGTVRRP